MTAKNEKRAWSIGVAGQCRGGLPELLRRRVPIDIVTDQTSAHDPLSHLPIGIELDDWAEYAEKKPEEFTDRARESMAAHAGDGGVQDRGAEVFDYGNSIRDEARLGATTGRSSSRASSRHTSGRSSARARGPFRWAALSGDP